MLNLQKIGHVLCPLRSPLNSAAMSEAALLHGQLHCFPLCGAHLFSVNLFILLTQFQVKRLQSRCSLQIPRLGESASAKALTPRGQQLPSQSCLKELDFCLPGCGQQFLYSNGVRASGVHY